MSNLKTSIRWALTAVFVALIALGAAPVHAQDSAAALPRHYQLELENEQVRVLHIKVQPNGKVDVHELNGAVVVPLIDYESTLKAGGKSVIVERKMGKAAWLPGGRREIEAGAKGVDALVIEIKSAPPAK